MNLTFFLFEILWKDVFSLTFTFSNFFSRSPRRTHILEFNSYALKKVILCSASFFYRLVNAVNFFSSLAPSLSLSFSYSSTSPSSSHPDSCYQRKKKEREKEPMAPLLRVIYTHTRSCGRQRGKEWMTWFLCFIRMPSVFFIHLPEWWEKHRRKFIIDLFIWTSLIFILNSIRRQKKKKSFFYFRIKYQTWQKTNER